MKNQAQIVISFELLSAVLLLPRNAKVLAVGQDFSDRLKECFRVLVEHESLPEVTEGAEPRHVDIEYDTDVDGNSRFVGWVEW